MEENGSGENGNRRRSHRFREPAETNRSVHFFKIILPSSIREEKLMMPKKFVGMFGQELSSNTLLSVPNGGVWQVGLEKSNGQIWFSDNWKKFIDYYSIDYGFLLVFKYEGNSSFNVLIFDTTATEIQYPVDIDGVELGDEVQRSDSVISISSSSSCGHSDRLSDDDECLHRPQVLNTTTCTSRMSDSTELRGVETRNKSKRKLEIRGGEIERKRRKVEDYCTKMGNFDVIKSNPRRKLQCQTRTAGSRAIRADTERLKTRNPSFAVTIHNRNIEKGYLYIPSIFATQYMSIEEEIIEVQAGSEGRKWKIVCCKEDSRKPTSKRMGKGCKVFCRENNLREGDEVVFELVKSSKNRVMKFSAAIL